MSLPSWSIALRYLHADVQPPSPVGHAHEFDGVGVSWLTDLRAGEDTPQDSTEDGAILLKDELQAFDGPVLPRAFIVDEKILKDDKAPKFTAYLFFDRADAAELAAATFANLAKAPERVIMNRVAEYAPSPNPIYGYKGIVEVAHSDRKSLDAALAAAHDAGVRPDLEVTARECLLWDGGPIPQVAESA
jgi:hypothetical protein